MTTEETKEWIDNIIDNEFKYCFRDCSADNIDQLTEVLERYYEYRNKH